MTHRTLDELKRVFGEVKVTNYWLGMIFMAMAVNNEV